jgi:hypothetical protein
LLAGAAVRLVAVSTVVRSSFERVVLHDMRGRRRWQAAEDALVNRPGFDGDLVYATSPVGAVAASSR